VARRHVFYIPGYDPIHPRRYRELFRREGAAQAALGGYRLQLAPRAATAAYGWHVEADIEGQRTATEIEVLVWSDIVRASMGLGILATYRQLVRTAATYVGSGAIFRLARLRKGPTIAALYPIAMLGLQLGLALAVGAGVFAILRAALPGGAGAVIGLLAGLGVMAAALAGFRRIDGRLYAYYLMHDYAHAASARGAWPADLAPRMRDFAAAVTRALDGPCDEVLVVGHSSGAAIAVSVLADVIRAGHARPDGPALSFLSLGQVIPMLSFLPAATRLRGDLAYLSARAELTWVDVTAPGDGCAFALCDPVAVSGVAPQGRRWPVVLSAAFSKTLGPARWRALRWRFFRLHFQYLCAFDALPGRPDDYDYFRVTAGPLTLADRLAGRAPSRSRIETPLSGYTTTA
jgi:hypothetical protein